MPTPAFFELHATRLWPHRWVFGTATFVVFLVFSALLLAAIKFRFALPVAVGPLFAVFSTAICWLWGLMLAGVWFHPSRGNARLGSPWFLGAPRIAQVLFRWYAAFFLALWFAIPVVSAGLLLARWAAA